MQRLDLHSTELPDLQFVLMVAALCTSDVEVFNVPRSVRDAVFNRCWALLHEGPPPENPTERVLNLRQGDEVTLEALVHVIRETFSAHGITELTWDHPVSEPSQESTPEARPLVERLQRWEPTGDGEPPDPSSTPHSPGT